METLKLQQVRYEDLNSRQKENFNFQKLSGVLADFGFVTMRLNDDWHGADFIAQHVNGQTFIRVQLKSRLSFRRTYQGKDLYIAFMDRTGWYLLPHDEVLEHVLGACAAENELVESVRFRAISFDQFVGRASEAAIQKLLRVR